MTELRGIPGTCFDIDGNWWNGHGPGSPCRACVPRLTDRSLGAIRWRAAESVTWPNAELGIAQIGLRSGREHQDADGVPRHVSDALWAAVRDREELIAMIERLGWAADHLLHGHDCDHLAYEQFQAAWEAAGRPSYAAFIGRLTAGRTRSIEAGGG